MSVEVVSIDRYSNSNGGVGECCVYEKPRKSWSVDRGWRSLPYLDHHGDGGSDGDYRDGGGDSDHVGFDEDRARVDLMSLLLERMFEITGYSLRFVDGRLVYPDGELAVSRLERTLSVYDNKRFLAEKSGWLALESMMRDVFDRLKSSGVEGGVWFAWASPPGDTYRFKDKPSMSASFFVNLRPDGSVSVYSVYSREIDAMEHWNMITATIDDDEKIELSDPIDIVSTPVFVGDSSRVGVVLNGFGVDGVSELEDRVNFLKSELVRDDFMDIFVYWLVHTMEYWLRDGGVMRFTKDGAVWLSLSDIAEVVDEVVERSTTAWTYGEILSWMLSGKSMVRWVEISMLRVLKELGHDSFASWYSGYIGLSMEEWMVWSGRWNMLMDDPLFLEQYFMSMHGGGIGFSKVIESMGFVIAPGFSDFRMLFMDRNEVVCPECGTAFYVGSRTKACPSCGKEVDRS